MTVAFTVLKMDAGPVLRQQTRRCRGRRGRGRFRVRLGRAKPKPMPNPNPNPNRSMAGDEHFPELLIEMFETGTELLVEALPSVWDGSCKDVLVPQVDAVAKP